MSYLYVTGVGNVDPTSTKIGDVQRLVGGDVENFILI